MPPRPANDRPCQTTPSDEAAEIDLLAALLERKPLHGSGRAAVAAGDLIQRFGGLAGVAAADPSALIRAGFSPQAVAEIRRVRDLAIILTRTEACQRPVLSSWSALVAYLRASLAHAPREQFRTLFLDKRNILMRDEHRAEGTIDHAPVYNAGPSRVAPLGRVPDIAETRAYVSTVVDCYLALTAGRRVTSSRQCAVQEAVR
jgi:DNA repair protein RadC